MTADRCICDGAAYHTAEENQARRPFIVNPGCPVHAPVTADHTQEVETWIAEAMRALSAATTIGQRSCRDGDHLNYGNHDRLLASGPRVLAALRAECDVLREQTARVEALHTREGAPNPADGLSYFCAHCSSMVQDYVNWPCPTIAALHPLHPDHERTSG